MTPLMSDALGYIDRDISIIPVKGKKPSIPKWSPYKGRRATVEQVQAWFASNGRRKPNGVAAISGAISGNLVCRDFDIRESYERWRDEHPTLAAEIPTSQTPRGYHVIFKHEFDRIIKLGDGELRGDGYFLLPPSKPGNWEYRWLISLPDGPLPKLDPFEVGLARLTEDTEDIEDTEDTKAIVGLESAENFGPEIEKAIHSTLPRKEGDRNDQVFDLARALKGIPAFTEAHPDAMRPFVEDWHGRAYPVIGTKPFTDTWADFIHAWKRVKYPRGAIMSKVLERVDNSPPPPSADRYDCPKMKRLVSICRELQRSSGSGPFFLSCRIAGEVAGFDHTTAWKRLGLLEHDHILQLVEKGTKTKAARYQYIAEH